jgi:tetratricopeptide (TPR) repeat protein
VQAALPPGTSILATSRHATVASALGSEDVLIEPFSVADAMTLIRRLVPSSRLDIEKRAVADLLDVVGRLPLAVALLARRIALSTPNPDFRIQTLLDLVRNDPLQTPYVKGAPRLSAVFAISYDALSAQEQLVFRSLGVFSSDDVDRDAIQAVVDMHGAELFAILESLVLCSLMRWHTTVGWYRLHPLHHEYATLVSRTNNNVERAAMTANHAAYHVQLVSRLVDRSRTDRVDAPLALDLALPELVRASKTLREARDVSKLDALATALGVESDFLLARGYFREARTIFSAAHSATKEAGLLDRQAVHATHLGTAHHLLGSPDRAEQSFQEAADIAASIGNQSDEAAAQGNLGLVWQSLGRHEDAAVAFEKALALAQASDNIEIARDQLSHLGSHYRDRDPDRALRYWLAASVISKKTGNSRAYANDVSNVGLLHLDVGDTTKAEQLISKALEIAQSIGDRKGEANRYGHLGNIALVKGDPSRAREFFERALELVRLIGQRGNEPPWLIGLALSASALGQKEEALQYLRSAMAVAQEVSDPRSEAIAALNVARIYQEAGQTTEARRLARKHLETLRKLAPRMADRIESQFRELLR